MKRFAALFMIATPAFGAHQGWQVSHQSDRFIDRVMMEAWADADQSHARMTLYCDTENGFRVMIQPHRALVPEGPAQITLAVDDSRPALLTGDVFGDDTTDVVTLHDSDRLQRALSGARHVTVHVQGIDGKSGDDVFTFGDLTAQRPILMKTCPLPK